MFNLNFFFLIPEKKDFLKFSKIRKYGDVIPFKKCVFYHDVITVITVSIDIMFW